MSHTTGPSLKKEYPHCYRCGEADKTVEKCGNMEWCEPCRKILISMTADNDEQQRYVPDRLKKPRQVLVNNVDRVYVKDINKKDQQ